MQIKNAKSRYGLVAILFHWIIAVGVIGLFALGLWMDDLGYYDKWYRTAPHLHKSFGVLLIVLVALRLIWRLYNVRPAELESHKPWERVLAKITHLLFYLLLFSMLVTGYLITTAKGQALDVFNWFSIPSLVTSEANLEDIAGEIHEIIAFTIIGLAIAHALAALKHHFIDRDSTLLRMLGRAGRT